MATFLAKCVEGLYQLLYVSESNPSDLVFVIESVINPRIAKSLGFGAELHLTQVDSQILLYSRNMILLINFCSKMQGFFLTLPLSLRGNCGSFLEQSIAISWGVVRGISLKTGCQQMKNCVGKF